MTAGNEKKKYARSKIVDGSILRKQIVDGEKVAF
jgi:hypothetical protein